MERTERTEAARPGKREGEGEWKRACVIGYVIGEILEALEAQIVVKEEDDLLKDGAL